MHYDGHDAQRRPGPRPRRHPRAGHRVRPREPRSTKAGAETPATRSRARRTPSSRSSLNEGRGRDPGDTPRRHSGMRRCDALNEGRGRDPGDTGRTRSSSESLHSAQRRPGPRPRRHKLEQEPQLLLAPSLNEGRGRDPGDTAARRAGSWHAIALNEGRGRDPGDTPCGTAAHALRWARRSTKAGAETPATPPRRAPRSSA